MTSYRVSIKDVAKKAGVSQSAVSRVLNNNGYISEEKRTVINKVIEELGFRPNAVARSLVRSRSKTIGLCMPYLNSPFIANLMKGVETEAEKHGYDVFMCHSKEDPAFERKAIIRMIDRQVDGMIITPVAGKESSIAEFMRLLPIIVLLRKPSGVNKNLILAADYTATRQSFGLLLDKGHRRIGIIAGPADVSTMKVRWKGVCDELKARGLDLDDRYVVRPPFEYHDSYEAAKRLLLKRNPPTAMYSLHYWGASAILALAYDLDLSIPQDLSAVSYESFEDWNLMSSLKLASNIFPASAMGATAVSALCDLIAKNQLYIDANIEVALDFCPNNSVKDIT